MLWMCIEFWINRYQTLIAGIIAVAAAVSIGRRQVEVAARQAKIMERQIKMEMAINRLELKRFLDAFVYWQSERLFYAASEPHPHDPSKWIIDTREHSCPMFEYPYDRTTVLKGALAVLPDDTSMDELLDDLDAYRQLREDDAKGIIPGDFGATERSDEWLRRNEAAYRLKTDTRWVKYAEALKAA